MFIDEKAEEKYRKMRLNEVEPEPQKPNLNEQKDEKSLDKSNRIGYPISESEKD